MFILASTSDKLQLTNTGTSPALDVQASYVDYSAGVATPDRKNTLITTAATTDIVASPAASTQRNVKHLSIRNRGIYPAVVTLIHTDGTTAVEVFKATLPSATHLFYDGEGGFRVVSTLGGRLSVTERIIVSNGTWFWQASNLGIGGPWAGFSAEASPSIGGYALLSDGATGTGTYLNNKTGGEVGLRINNATIFKVVAPGAGVSPSVIALGRIIGLPPVTVTYSTTPTIDTSLGNIFVITPTNGTAFAIAAPTNVTGASGQMIWVTIRNTFGVLGAITWNSVFKLHAITPPANGFSVTVPFYYNGTNWIQCGEAIQTVPN